MALQASSGDASAKNAASKSEITAPETKSPRPLAEKRGFYDFLHQSETIGETV